VGQVEREKEVTPVRADVTLLAASTELPAVSACYAWPLEEMDSTP
jgi:hypothetical protein